MVVGKLSVKGRMFFSFDTDNAIRAVDHQRTLMYWHIGKRIFEEEQEGKDRADYGAGANTFFAVWANECIAVNVIRIRMSFFMVS